MRFGCMVVVVGLIAASVVVAADRDSMEVGAIGGSVFCRETSEPIPEAIVLVAGTNWGVLADSAGCFVIAGVRPGVYRVSGAAGDSRSGYRDSVWVAAGCTTYVQLGLEVSYYLCCCCSASRDVLHVSETQSLRQLNHDDIRALPATDVYEILRKRGGVAFR